MFVKSEVEWLKQHGRCDGDGRWWCKKTGAAIAVAEVGRSIHDPRFVLAGSGEVRSITHMACQGCEPNKVPPRYGAPISEADLVSSITV